MVGEHRHDASVGGSHIKLRGAMLWNLFDLRLAFALVPAELQMDFSHDMDRLDAVLPSFSGSIGTNRSQELTRALGEVVLGTMASVSSEHLV